MRRILPTACLLLGLAALPASADSLLERARAISKEGPSYILDMNFDYGSTDRFKMTVDQSRPEGERVIAFTPDPATLTGDAARRAERLQARTGGDVWCNRFMVNIPANARRIADAAGRATYRFTPQPGPDEDGDIARAYRHLEGTAIIDAATGYLHRFTLTAPKPFKPAVVAKVDTFSMDIACAAAPDGRTHVETFRLNLNGSAMMQAFSQTETRQVSILSPARTASAGAR